MLLAPYKPDNIPELPCLFFLSPSLLPHLFERSLLGNMLFTYKPLSTISLIRFSHSRSLSTCFSHLRARFQTTRDSRYAQSPQKLFKLANLETAYPALLISSHGSHKKSLLLIYPLFSLSCYRSIWLSCKEHPLPCENCKKISFQ